jgi:hypothetical protein
MKPKTREGGCAANPKISLAFQERIYPLVAHSHAIDGLGLACDVL